MTDDIRQSLSRLGQINPADLDAASDLVGLLQLTQTAVDSRAELSKLAGAASKAVGRVLKKAPK